MTRRPLESCCRSHFSGFGLCRRRPVSVDTLRADRHTGLPSTRNGEWPHYADLNGTRYSPLDQINGTNFSKLEVAWRFKTDSFGPFPEFKLEGTPLMVKGVLYDRRHPAVGDALDRGP
jgi:glucose dehydrogenase